MHLYYAHSIRGAHTPGERTPQEVIAQLHEIMKNIHATCVKRGTEGTTVNYVKGANISLKLLTRC